MRSGLDSRREFQRVGSVTELHSSVRSCKSGFDSRPAHQFGAFSLNSSSGSENNPGPLYVVLTSAFCGNIRQKRDTRRVSQMPIVDFAICFISDSEGSPWSPCADHQRGAAM